MDSFEVIINNEAFTIKLNNTDEITYSVFNHATCHIIKKNNFGIWQAVEHRFGKDQLPIDEIGEAVDKYNSQFATVPVFKI